MLAPLAFLRGQQPVPAYLSPGNARAAQALYNAIRQAAPSNPLPFVGNPLNPGTDSYYFSPNARNSWENWIDDILPVNPEIPPPIYAPAQGFRIGVVARWKNVITGERVEDRRGTLANPPDPNVIYYGPLNRGAYKYQSGEIAVATAIQARRNPNGAVEVIEVTNGLPSTLYEYIDPPIFVTQEIDGEQRVGYVPSPGYFPGVAPQAVPTTVPIEIPFDEPDESYPFPFTQPGYLPVPYTFPTEPVPFIPGTPEVPDRDSPLPPMWVTPDGIEVGSPPASALSRPRGATSRSTTPQTQTQYERERIPPIVTTCFPDPPSDCCDCDDIREIVIEELDNKFPPKRPFTNNSTLYTASNSRCVSLPQFVDKIILDIVTKPINARFQSGGTNAPDVYYCGWCEFGDSNSGGERIPVHFVENTYFPPVGATSFCYTLYEGFTGSLRVDYRQEV